MDSVQYGIQIEGGWGGCPKTHPQARSSSKHFGVSMKASRCQSKLEPCDTWMSRVPEVNGSMVSKDQWVITHLLINGVFLGVITH